MSTRFPTKRWQCIKLLLLYTYVFVLINSVDSPSNSETITIDCCYAIGAFGVKYGDETLTRFLVPTMQNRDFSQRFVSLVRVTKY